MAEINWPDFQFPPVNLWSLPIQSGLLKAESVDSPTARKWTCAGKVIKCAYCGRNKFCTPQPHKCSCGNIRKRRLRWVLINELRIDKRIK